MEQQAFLSSWAEFNRLKWNCKAVISRFQAPDSEAYCDSLFFLDRRGKLYLPPLNPYHLTAFYPTPTKKAFRINKQWHKIADLMSNELLKVGGSANFILPPEIIDIRPFIWRGFKVEVKYTYYLKLPYSIAKVDGMVRNKMNRANADGYRSILTDNLQDAHECLIGTEARKGFSHHLALRDLELAKSLLGERAFRCYVCYSKEGEPVSTSICLILNDKRAIGWVAGSKSKHLSRGVAQQLQGLELQDLCSMGISEVDFCGANIESVSVSKSHWGGELVPYYAVRMPGYKELLRAGKQWITFTGNMVSH